MAASLGLDLRVSGRLSSTPSAPESPRDRVLTYDFGSGAAERWSGCWHVRSVKQVGGDLGQCLGWRSVGMAGLGLRRIVESGTFVWPWPTSRGLVIVTGATGGGGGGALCIQGLNLYGARGGDGGDGGGATMVTIGQTTYQAAGGNGGNGGGLIDGKPVKGAIGPGCRYGDGAVAAEEEWCLQLRSCWLPPTRAPNSMNCLMVHSGQNGGCGTAHASRMVRSPCSIARWILRPPRRKCGTGFHAIAEGRNILEPPTTDGSVVHSMVFDRIALEVHSG